MNIVNVICPICGSPMRYDERNYWVCGKCLGEFWPREIERGAYEKAVVKTKDSMYYFGLAEQATAIASKPISLAGEPVRKGSSKSGKRRKKKPKRDRFIVYET